MHKASLLFIYKRETGIESSMSTFRSGPPDLVRRLALVKTRISVFMVHKI